MDLALTDEQLAFRQVARAWLDATVVPHRRDWDRAEQVDTAIIRGLGEMGFLGLTIPEEYGGIGGDYITYALAMEELGRADSSVRGIVSVSNGLVGKPILGFGTEQQKQHWLRLIATGEALGCFGLTEAETGSDAGNLSTRAVRDGTDRGFVRTEIKGKLGLRGQATAQLAFDGVRVPESARLGAEGQGFTIAMAALDKGRVSVAAGCVGIIAGCLETTREYAVQRTQFGRPIARFQLVQEMIADISVDADAARLLTWRAADLIERGLPFTVAASKAKLFASEAAVRAANLAGQVFGGYGYIDDYPAQKYLRDARVMTLYEGTSQIQKLLIGRAETGVSAFL